jgi:type IV secretory pathway VirB4 component
VRTRPRHGPHRATTLNLGAAYPFQAEPGLGSHGVYIGREVGGGAGAFCYDFWELQRQGLLVSPNEIVIGALRFAKSALVKTQNFRSLAIGHFCDMLDPKGENRLLCETVGVDPVLLEPNGRLRLNPLDRALVRRDEHGSARMLQEQFKLLRAVVEAALDRPGGGRLGAEEQAALEQALRRAGEVAVERGRQPELGDVIEALFHPTDQMAAHLHMRGGPEDLATRCREPALALRRLVEGDLAGMFDGQTSPNLDLEAPLLSLDLSEVYNSPALPILMACANTFLQQRLLAFPDRRHLLTIDEGWVMMRELATARLLQEVFKFAGKTDTHCILVAHRFSDMEAAGNLGSEQRQIARGLISDAGTHVVYHQQQGEVKLTAELLDLSEREARLIPTLERGVALWHVGEHRFVVEHRRSELEERITETRKAVAA